MFVEDKIKQVEEKIKDLGNLPKGEIKKLKEKLREELKLMKLDQENALEEAQEELDALPHEYWQIASNVEMYEEIRKKKVRIEAYIQKINELLMQL